MELARQLRSISHDGRRIGELARAAPAERVESCPLWTGRDLLAHVSGFARLVGALIDAAGGEPPPAPEVDPAEAASTYDRGLARLVERLGGTPPDAPVWNWSVAPRVAGFWTRRAVHELAVHHWDAETIGGGHPAPIATDVAEDGIAEFFEVFVATGLAAGMVPPAPTTLALELTDSGKRVEHQLAGPGPVTTMRGSTSDVLLALWRRLDPLSLRVDGDRRVLEAWPTI
jgi:uncharacterized protein (TIGR03083 family)